MSNATNPSLEEFRRSLEALVQQAQHTAQLGFTVAKEQVETLVRTPPDLPTSIDEVQRNFQALARDIEARAQELLSLAANYVPGQGPFAPPARPSAPVTEVKIEREGDAGSETPRA
jgi:hypothetical protein